MFWKKKQTEAKPTEKKAKEKKLSPMDIIMDKIEQLVLGESLSYHLPPIYGDDLAIVQLNPDYPNKGRKYALFSEKLVDGKPCGQRVRLWYSDKPRDIANWIHSRDGVPYS